MIFARARRHARAYAHTYVGAQACARHILYLFLMKNTIILLKCCLICYLKKDSVFKKHTILRLILFYAALFRFIFQNQCCYRFHVFYICFPSHLPNKSAILITYQLLVIGIYLKARIVNVCPHFFRISTLLNPASIIASHS